MSKKITKLIDIQRIYTEQWEGRRYEMYIDSTGHRSIGVGLNLDSEYGKKTFGRVQRPKGWMISDKEIDMFFNHQLRVALADVREVVGNWDTLSDARKVVLWDMMFNLGMSKFMSFKKMRAALQAGDFKKASEEILDSRYARQVGRRAEMNAYLMEKGAFDEY